MTPTLTDHKQRTLALDISQSFIVQAPAGSGKTELLTQRYLALLANVQQPEEIIALTFTRKAAAEMRERIIHAIEKAATQARPALEHEQRAYDLATQVLQQNQHQQWDILNNPNRLRIYTIDALCAKLVRHMPLQTQFISQAAISDDAQSLYRQAAQQLITDLNPNNAWHQPLLHLLLHLDNRQSYVETLLIEMLGKRDQWLPYIFAAKNSDDLRARLEAGLQHSNEELFTELNNSFPAEFADEIYVLILYALANNEDNAALELFRDLDELPECTIANKSHWLFIADFLLTKGERGWRKQVDKRQGFPAASGIKDKQQKHFANAAKQRMLELLLQLNNHEYFRLQLAQLIDSPPLHYDDAQWLIVDALVELLPYLAAQLQLIFQQQNTVDFIEVSSQALQALGHFDDPSDLALQLDYQIKHLLVDEFQDTSTTQSRLLEHLTAGWQAGDGRSLFLVGDPMQSIYRFRQAQVGLFLQAQHYGLSNVALTSLQLTTNFRSELAIVDWVNNNFSTIFPQKADPAIGAVPYHPSTALHNRIIDSHVAMHACSNRTDEAKQISQLIQQTKQRDPQLSIALLVSARSHLIDIITEFKNEKIDYHAIELDSLANSLVVSDLWHLSKALLFLNNRLAWLTILRAPWCGLMLADLHIIAAAHLPTTIFDNSNNSELIKLLSTDGQQRLQRFAIVINTAYANRARLPLREWIEQTWLALGGPACLQNENQLDEADYFFKELEKQPQNPYQLDFVLFERRLTKLYADNTSTAANPVQLMTIHKAKGLEFDVVIIPGLDRRTMQNQSQLMLWQERTGEHQHNDLLIAPIKATEYNTDPIYQFLKQQEQIKDQHEQARLLYVAVTRAKSELHLFAKIASNEEGEVIAPNKKSLLQHLWPKQQEIFANLSVTTVDPESNTDTIAIEQQIYRLTSNWQNCYAVDELLPHAQGHNPTNSSEYYWQASDARHSGTLIHSYLQKMSAMPQQQWPQLLDASQQQYWRVILQQYGVRSSVLENCCQQIHTALSNVIEDEQAQWFLSQQQDAHSEWAINAIIAGSMQQLVIDRSFIDNNGTRWIIDYKTASPGEQTVEEFLKMQQEKYIPQLQLYADALSLYEQRPTQLALYFPMLKLLYNIV